MPVTHDHVPSPATRQVRPAVGRVPNETHTARPWRIHELVSDFDLEDVWAFRVYGTARDFDDVVELVTGGPDLVARFSAPARAVWWLRDRIGSLVGFDRISAPVGDDPDWAPIPGSTDRSLRDRLPVDLRDTVAGLRFRDVPFVPVYRTADEFVAELSNRTVHAVMHVTWVHDGNGSYHAEMASYAKPRGLVGAIYMVAIMPFRRWVVYPSLLKAQEQAWTERSAT